MTAKMASEKINQLPWQYLNMYKKSLITKNILYVDILDMTKVYDTIQYDILPNKLNGIGICSKIIKRTHSTTLEKPCFAAHAYRQP